MAPSSISTAWPGQMSYTFPLSSSATSSQTPLPPSSTNIRTAENDTAYPRRVSWTASEDAILTQAIEQQRGNGAKQISWKQVSEQLPGRRTKDCRKRWTASLTPDIHKGAWSPSEDAALCEAVRLYACQWSKIAAHVGRRTGDQCSCRWDVLSSGTEWTDAQDKTLLRFVKKNGKRWSDVRKHHLPQFTSAACRNRYNRLIRRLSAECRKSAELATLQLACLDDDADETRVDRRCGDDDDDVIPSDDLQARSPVQARCNSVARHSVQNRIRHDLERTGDLNEAHPQQRTKAVTAEELSFTPIHMSGSRPSDDYKPVCGSLQDCSSSSTSAVMASANSPQRRAFENCKRACFKRFAEAEDFLRQEVTESDVRERLVQLAELIIATCKEMTGSNSTDEDAATKVLRQQQSPQSQRAKGSNHHDAFDPGLSPPMPASCMSQTISIATNAPRTTQQPASYTSAPSDFDPSALMANKQQNGPIHPCTETNAPLATSNGSAPYHVQASWQSPAPGDPFSTVLSYPLTGPFLDYFLSLPLTQTRTDLVSAVPANHHQTRASYEQA